jgi:acyl-CoA thioester hydrolase
MPAVFEYRRRVKDEEIDELGHAGNQAYLAWMIEAAVGHSQAQGWSAARYFSLGAAWVVRRHEIDYLLPAMPGDVLMVRTWVASLSRATSERRYEILRPTDGKLLARALTVWAWVDRASGRVGRIPEPVASAFTVTAADSLP